MREPAKAVYLDQCSVSRLVRRLEATELTERRKREEDKRGATPG